MGLGGNGTLISRCSWSDWNMGTPAGLISQVMWATACPQVCSCRARVERLEGSSYSCERWNGEDRVDLGKAVTRVSKHEVPGWGRNGDEVGGDINDVLFSVTTES